MEAETFLCFGPDELSEAHNRGYRLARAGGTPVAVGPADAVGAPLNNSFTVRHADPRLPPRLSRRAPDARDCPR